MKCKRCGSELKETDKICLNCGFLINHDINDLYDDINDSDDDETFDDDEVSDNESYNKELEDLLNTYKKDEKNNKNNNTVDYSSFDDINVDNKKTNINNNIVNDYNTEFNNPSVDNNIDNKMSDYTIDNLITVTDSNYKEDEMDEYSSFDKSAKKEKKKIEFDFGLSIVPFKIVFIIALIVLIGVLGMFGYKYIKSHSSHETDVEINKDDDIYTSKYSLKTNPNYIASKTWICADKLDNGEMSADTSTYFQYDFNSKNNYAMQYLNREDTYEHGKYYVSLEDISNDQYTYKLTMIALLDGGYKTRYTFTLVTNKDGTNGTYKMNNTSAVCEEMNYFNSKIGG